MKGKFSLGLIGVVLIMGMALIGCDNGTTDNGTAPTLTEVIVANSFSNANNWVSVNTFDKGVDIYVGAKVDDPDADIVKVWYGVKDSTGNLTPFTGELICPLPSYPYSGVALIIQLSQLPLDQQTSTVGTDYAIELCFIDSKGNRSETKVSNIFEITNVQGYMNTLPYKINNENTVLTFNIMARGQNGIGHTPDDPECDTWTLVNDDNKGTFPLGKWTGGEHNEEYILFKADGILQYKHITTPSPINGIYSVNTAEKTISYSAW